MCPFCNGKETLYQSTRYAKLYMEAFGEAKILVVERDGCPSFSDCGMKNLPLKSAFIINYCPECGRKLSE